MRGHKALNILATAVQLQPRLLFGHPSSGDEYDSTGCCMCPSVFPSRSCQWVRIWSL